jgi:hypothetical protein
MAHVWIRKLAETVWAVLPLTGGVYVISEQGFSLLEDGGYDNLVSLALLVRCDNGSVEHWMLLARQQASVQVNGWPLVLGARLLCDRDEIVVRADGSSATFHCFFATERLPQVAAYPGGAGAICCPRCKQPIEPNQMAVQCPNASCGAWHHQKADLQCWTYSDTCALCDRPTQLDAGFRFNPEDL